MMDEVSSLMKIRASYPIAFIPWLLLLIDIEKLLMNGQPRTTPFLAVFAGMIQRGGYAGQLLRVG